MISFNQFLAESRSAPLYHATTTIMADQIIHGNELKRGKSIEHGLDKRTVSLTRNFRFARNWLNEMSSGSGVIFELDQRKLSQRYKIVPYNFFSRYNNKARVIPAANNTYSKKRDWDFENQFEEAVLADIKPISRFINKVYIVDNLQIAKFFEDFIEELDRMNIKVEHIK